MAVGLKLGSVTTELGTSEFVYAFFSTISGNLERHGWGSRFPVLLTKLYAGSISQLQAQKALDELGIVLIELSGLPVRRVIWNLEDRSKRPPWGDEISSDITSLGDYFVTSTGRDMIGAIREVLTELRDKGGTVSVVAY